MFESHCVRVHDNGQAYISQMKALQKRDFFRSMVVNVLVGFKVVVKCEFEVALNQGLSIVTLTTVCNPLPPINSVY
jgi:hypothetical protein